MIRTFWEHFPALIRNSPPCKGVTNQRFWSLCPEWSAYLSGNINDNLPLEIFFWRGIGFKRFFSSKNTVKRTKKDWYWLIHGDDIHYIAPWTSISHPFCLIHSLMQGCIWALQVNSIFQPQLHPDFSRKLPFKVCVEKRTKDVGQACLFPSSPVNPPKNRGQK